MGDSKVCALGGKLIGEGEVGVVQASSSSVTVYILRNGQKHAWRREMGRGRGRGRGGRLYGLTIITLTHRKADTMKKEHNNKHTFDEQVV